MMGKKQKLTSAGFDVLYGKQIYCYLKRSGASSNIKRDLRQAYRRQLKKELYRDNNT